MLPAAQRVSSRLGSQRRAAAPCAPQTRRGRAKGADRGWRQLLPRRRGKGARASADRPELQGRAFGLRRPRVCTRRPFRALTGAPEGQGGWHPEPAARAPGAGLEGLGARRGTGRRGGRRSRARGARRRGSPGWGLPWDPAGVSRPGRLLDGPGPGCGLLRRPRRVTQARSPRGAGARKWREALSRPRAPHFPVPGQVSVLPGPAARLALFGPGRCLSVPPCDQGAHTRWRCAGGRRDRNESGGVR